MCAIFICTIPLHTILNCTSFKTEKQNNFDVFYLLSVFLEIDRIGIIINSGRNENSAVL